eukprot:11174618-Lingulodinium_polyedra.AAC.1
MRLNIDGNGVGAEQYCRKAVWHASLRCAAHVSLMSYMCLVDVLQARCQHIYMPHVPEALFNQGV